MGETVLRLNNDVRDIVGELANIVAGSAKSEFDNLDVTFTIGIPTVLVGKAYASLRPVSGPVAVVPFRLRGDIILALEISMSKIETLADHEQETKH